MPITTSLPLEAARARLISDSDDKGGNKRYAMLKAAKDKTSARRVLGVAELRNELTARNELPNRSLKERCWDSPEYSGWILVENMKHSSEKRGLLWQRDTWTTHVAGLLLSQEAQLVEYTTSLQGLFNGSSADNLLGKYASQLKWRTDDSLPCDTINLVNVSASPDDVDPQLARYTRSLKLEDLFAGMVVTRNLVTTQVDEA